jgi:ABC-type uncharacterized transport system permease subunit|tara:strand:- start:380 stop:1186 length:807 start_codon:yes stop_codon:yes gene_type:complete
MLIATTSIMFYLIATIYHALQLSDKVNKSPFILFVIAGIAIILNGYACFQWILTDEGIVFSLASMTAVIVFTVNFIVLVGSFRRQSQNLLLVLFPLSALILSIATTTITMKAKSIEILSPSISSQVGFHVFVSILSYSLLTIAAFQALFLALQEWRLRHKHFGSFSEIFPSIQTMESLLFEILWAGFALLTLSLGTGLVFFEDFFGQHLAHKTFFSLFSWVFFAILLWGRHAKGWRGKTAIRWTLAGFSFLFVAYWGTKFILEIVLSK